MFIVYINEAHSIEKWNIGESAGALNHMHQKIEDRVNYLLQFVKKYNIAIPMYADNINNDFETQFASWPFRYFITKGKTIVKMGEPNEAEFDYQEFYEFLEVNS